MRNVYYIAVCQVKDGPRHVFVVHPNGDLTDDKRTPEEIVQAASDKGCEVSYCALYTYGLGYYTADSLRAKLVNAMRFRYADVRSEWDLEIDVVNRIIIR